jgi:hypothetical protein
MATMTPMKAQVLRQIADRELAGTTAIAPVTPAQVYDRFRRRLLQRVYYGEDGFCSSLRPAWIPPPPKR